MTPFEFYTESNEIIVKDTIGDALEDDYPHFQRALKVATAALKEIKKDGEKL